MAPGSVGQRSVPEVYGHSCARLRSRVVLPLPDGPVITRVSPAANSTSRVSMSWSPAGLRTSTASITTAPSALGTVRSSGNARDFASASTRPSSRMIAARNPANSS